MEEAGWDLFVTGDPKTVYYFTGVLASAGQPACFAFTGQERAVLVAPGAEPGAATDFIPLETYSISRTITEPHHDAAELLRSAGLVGRAPAVECSGTGVLVANQFSGAADATGAVLRLRKRKEPDEVEEIRAALRLNDVAYRTARATIAPGLTEIDVYNAMSAAITREAGRPVPFPGDFSCGLRSVREGGAPTHRVIAPGDLYVLDLFPAPALYAGDTCRTFAVGAPTAAQHRGWELVREAVVLGESLVRPGVAARDVYARIKAFLDDDPLTRKSFWHHAGHGIGFNGHEAPRIIPGGNDIFEPGDVITLEPGIYLDELQGGIRLEDNYLVTGHGIENLFSYCPMGL